MNNNYAVSDKQDVLAMCALQFASKIRNSFTLDTTRNKHMKQFDKINELTNMVSEWPFGISSLKI